MPIRASIVFSDRDNISVIVTRFGNRDIISHDLSPRVQKDSQWNCRPLILQYSSYFKNLALRDFTRSFASSYIYIQKRKIFIACAWKTTLPMKSSTCAKKTAAENLQ